MVTDIITETLVKTDLRDSGGRRAKILLLKDFVGTYNTGGIVIDPEWFGLRKIDTLIVQSSTAIPFSGADQPWTLVSFITVMNIDSGVANGESANGISEWRMIVHVNNGTTFEELGDDQALDFPEGLYPTMIVIGKPL